MKATSASPRRSRSRLSIEPRVWSNSTRSPIRSSRAWYSRPSAAKPPSGSPVAMTILRGGGDPPSHRLSPRQTTNSSTAAYSTRLRRVGRFGGIMDNLLPGRGDQALGFGVDYLAHHDGVLSQAPFPTQAAWPGHGPHVPLGGRLSLAEDRL